jgi:hypothetical protein
MTKLLPIQQFKLIQTRILDPSNAWPVSWQSAGNLGEAGSLAFCSTDHDVCQGRSLPLFVSLLGFETNTTRDDFDLPPGPQTQGFVQRYMIACPAAQQHHRA